MSQEFSTLSYICPLMTNERISKALTDWFKEDYTFTHWEYLSETGKGDSGFSELIRIKIYGVNENGDSDFVQVILKNVPKSVSRTRTFRNHELFINEINFYKMVLPALLAFQSTKKPMDPYDKYTKLVFAFCDEKYAVVCIEDANVHSYTSTIRQEGIDLEHCKVTLKVLAQFHAISFAMKDQEPEKFEKLQNVLAEQYYDERLWDWYGRFWTTLCRVAIDAVEKEYPNSIYVDRVKKFAVRERYQDMINAATKTANIGVITHGDSWTSNFLYKYEGRRPVDAKMIDFQLSRCATPALDISILIYACTDEDLREKHFDECLEFYYDMLTHQIRDLGSDPSEIYPWEQFMTEVKKYSYFGLGFSFESIPFTVLAPEDAPNMDTEGDEMYNIDDVLQLGNFKVREGRLREANNVKHCVDMGFI